MWAIYHNQQCSKSRSALAFLEERGITPTVIHYLETPLTRPILLLLLDKLQHPIDIIIRTQEPEFDAIKHQWPAFTLEQKIDYVIDHPIILERPIVIHNDTAIVGRPDSSAILPLFEEA